MKEASPPKAPRDLLNLIVRVPASIRQQIAEEAENEKISQNQLINGYLFTVLFVQRFEPEHCYPKHLLRLFEAMESGLSRPNGLTFGAFHRDDWEAISGVVQQFADACLVTPPLTRSDPTMPTTVAYTFSITRYGQVQLPLLIRMIKPSLFSAGESAEESHQEEVPA